MANASLKAVLACLLTTSCSVTPPTHHWGTSSRTIESVLAANLLAPGQNIGVTNLGAADEVSHHIVQVRDAEALHVHANHDLTVFIYRGHGVMQVDSNQFPIATGDILFIPRGVPHAFTNKSGSPAVAIVAFTPAFDGKDTVPVKEER